MSLSAGIINSSSIGPDVGGTKTFYFQTPSTNTNIVFVGPIGSPIFPLEPGTSPLEFNIANMNRVEFSLTPPDVLNWISKEE